MKEFNLSLGILIVTLLSISIESSKIDDIFNKLDIEDKCGQMTQVTLEAITKTVSDQDRPTTIAIDYEKLLKYVKEYRVGSIFNSIGGIGQRKLVWHGIIKLIHDVVRNSTQHKIPIIYGIDSIHGAGYIDEATLFPQPLSMAATFNLDIAERIDETYGEDSFLAVKMGSAYIKGHQGDGDLTKKENTATCLKHFIGNHIFKYIFFMRFYCILLKHRLQFSV